MKILGKYKDYYDYLQGIYGVDPLLILDRRYKYIILRRKEEEGDKLISKTFFVAGKKYDMYYYKGKSYYTLDELNELNLILKKDEHPRSISMPWKYTKDDYNFKDEYPTLVQEWWDEINGKPTNINKKNRIPVLIRENDNGYRGRTDKEVFPCILSNWDFHKVLTPEEAYQQIATMMGYFVDNPPIPNKQTNMEKLLSHGFDKKKSFRHRK